MTKIPGEQRGLYEKVAPAAFLVLAVMLSMAFLACHALGLRQYTSFLFGMVSTGGAGEEMFVMLGLVYVIVYLAFFGLVPVLILGAGLLFMFGRLTGRRRLSA